MLCHEADVVVWRVLEDHCKRVPSTLMLLCIKAKTIFLAGSILTKVRSRTSPLNSSTLMYCSQKANSNCPKDLEQPIPSL